MMELWDVSATSYFSDKFISFYTSSSSGNIENDCSNTGSE
jgi:hypothetical protein